MEEEFRKLVHEEWKKHFDITSTIQNIPASSSRIRQALETIESYGKHKNYTKRNQTTKNYTHRYNPFEFAQIDLLFPAGAKREDNRGNIGLLVLIDSFSRYVFLVPIKQKSATDTWEAFKTILKSLREDMFRSTHMRIFADQGNEFSIIKQKKNQETYDYEIYHIPNRKPNIVERFNRTAQEWFRRLFTENGNTNWVDNIDTFLKVYNNRKHSTLGVSPQQALDNPLLANEIEKKTPKITNKYKIGDSVRILLKRKPNVKLTSRFSDETYEIKGIESNMYKLSDGNKYYESELVLSNSLSTPKEKKRRGRRPKNEIVINHRERVKKMEKLDTEINKVIRIMESMKNKLGKPYLKRANQLKKLREQKSLQ